MAAGEMIGEDRIKQDVAESESDGLNDGSEPDALSRCSALGGGSLDHSGPNIR